MNIVISGKQRAGKDSLAHFIEGATNGKWKRVGLADALKDEYASITGFSRENIEELKMIPQVRQQLILLGQARKKEGNKNVWLDRVPKDYALIADARYTEEVNYFKDAIKIRVECPREIRALRGSLSNEDHPSETELDSYTDWDYMIDGSKSKDAIALEITSILLKLKII